MEIAGAEYYQEDEHGSEEYRGPQAEGYASIFQHGAHSS